MGRGSRNKQEVTQGLKKVYQRGRESRWNPKQSKTNQSRHFKSYINIYIAIEIS